MGIWVGVIAFVIVVAGILIVVRGGKESRIFRRELRQERKRAGRVVNAKVIAEARRAASTDHHVPGCDSFPGSY